MKRTNSLFLRFIIGIGIMLSIACFALMLSSCSNGNTISTPEPKQGNDTLRGELTISTYHENSYLQAAAKKYEENHEGVTIKINEYMSRTDSRTGTDKNSDKYMQIVNTALIGGKGDDIIDVSRISFFRLADKNMLVDLNEYLGTALNETDYYMSVLDAYLYGDKRYTVPLSFNFEALYYSPEVAESIDADIIGSDVTLESLTELTATMLRGDNVLLFGGGAMGSSDIWLAYKLFSFDLNKFINMETKEVDIDNRDFISMLESVKNIADEKQIASHKGYGNGESLYTSETKSLINPIMVYTLAMSSNGTEDYSNLGLLVSKDGYSTFSSTGFNPTINNNSKNKELAADFIKFLLSDEMQSSTELLFCPVNKNSVKEASRLIYEDSKVGGYLPDGFNEESLERNIIKFNEMADKTIGVEYVDSNIRDFVMDEMIIYFGGEETAEQAAKNLQSKINAYLKE